MADLPRLNDAAVAELADAQDSKSCEGNLMRVQLSPAAPFVRGMHDPPRQPSPFCGFKAFSIFIDKFLVDMDNS